MFFKTWLHSCQLMFSISFIMFIIKIISNLLNNYTFKWNKMYL